MTAPLTSLSHGAGCGCKLSAADLRPIVASLPRPTDPRVLVAEETRLSMLVGVAVGYELAQMLMKGDS